MASKRVVVMEGDDAAPEAVRATLALVEKLGLDIERVHPPYGHDAMAMMETPLARRPQRANARPVGWE
jgi:hypothetical protein